MKKPPGRPKGAANKVSAQAKENIQAVFIRLGGTAEMARWAKANQTDFYKIYARLLPIEGPGEGGAHRFEVIAPWMRDAAKNRGWG